MAVNVFVHGYMGWGSFDIPYKAVPYWGMFTGDLLKRLRKQGFACVSASVAPLEQPKHQLGPADIPTKEPFTGITPADLTAGIWNVFQPYKGDHMSQMGGFFHRNKDVDHYYTELLTLLNELPSKQEKKDTET